MLGLLVAKPSTGYELTQRFDTSLAHAWHASHSQIYPELARLDEEGLAEVVEEGSRGSRTWAATAAGREEIRRWLVDPDPPRAMRNPTAVRWFLVALLPPEDARVVYEREIAFLEEDQAFLRGLAERLDAAPQRSPFRGTVDLGLQSGPVMIAWLREQLDALPTS